MGFDWDDANVEHMARHDVTPNEAEQVMLNVPIEIDYRVIEGEEKFVGTTRRPICAKEASSNDNEQESRSEIQ